MLRVRQKRRKNIWPSLKLKEVIIMRVRAEALIKSVVIVLGVLERDGPSLTERCKLAWIISLHLPRPSHCEIEALQWLGRLRVLGSESRPSSFIISADRSGCARDSPCTIRPVLLAQDVCADTSKVSKSCFFCSRAFCLTLHVITGILSQLNIVFSKISALI